jgi:hypothetical protein
MMVEWSPAKGAIRGFRELRERSYVTAVATAKDGKNGR